ncbi:IspD/TarI family cytidylyltransferase [Mycobacterium hubeiense]|uniref:IspD/TarI family cytidylyltransferase n=1 Tax=Mycobacterium hubeiense TaxID=1867256 RepID=UPI000C7F1D43|nr:2-C-methyl-D-erythritol 4-phosphate cytidylyltransferase [Mycobacterium sp. QGD 101]
MSPTEIAAIVPLPGTLARAAVVTPLAGEAALARVVASLAGAAQHIVVSSADALIDDARECLAAHGLSAEDVVAGGDTRMRCVAAGLEYLVGQPIPPRYVLIHDVRRPLASAGLRDRVIEGLRTGGTAVLPALPVTDSVKTVDEHGAITATVDREALRTMQYPRGFTLDRLAQLVARCSSEDFDELAESLDAGAGLTLVDGDADAFAAELPRDTDYVEAIIACRR